MAVRDISHHTLVYLIRHGETDWNVEGRFQGHSDTPLNDIGRKQAGAVARWLAHQPVTFNALYTSDLVRCVDTAQMIADELRLPMIAAPALRELHCGEWEGYTSPAIDAHYPGQLTRWRQEVDTFPIPGGESVTDVMRRVSVFYERTVVKHLGEAIIMVSHGGALSALLIAIDNVDMVQAWNDRDRRINNTGVTILKLDHMSGEHITEAFNLMQHLI